MRAATATPEVCARQRFACVLCPSRPSTIYLYGTTPAKPTLKSNYLILNHIPGLTLAFSSFSPRHHQQKPQIAPKPAMLGRPIQQRPPQETAAPDQPHRGEPEDDVDEDRNPVPVAAAANTTDGQIAEHGESPEKLSLKARLKLFEKEIEDQGSAPKPKAGVHFRVPCLGMLLFR